MKLKDQVAIVTGAGRNIGEDVAKLFAAEGAKIAVVDLDRPRGQRTVDAIKAAGGDAELYVTDVSKGADVAAMVKAVVGRFGRVDILVNNVAISDNKTIFECTEEDWDRVMTVTLKSQFLMSKHVAQQMVAQGGGGKIVNVGSTSGWQGRAARDRLFGGEGGDRQLHPRAGGAACAAQHPRQRDRAEQDRLAGRQGRVRSDPAGREHAQASRPADGSGEGDPVPGRATIRRSSSARTCSSTAAPWRWTRRER